MNDIPTPGVYNGMPCLFFTRLALRDYVYDQKGSAENVNSVLKYDKNQKFYITLNAILSRNATYHPVKDTDITLYPFDDKISCISKHMLSLGIYKAQIPIKSDDDDEEEEDYFGVIFNSRQHIPRLKRCLGVKVCLLSLISLHTFLLLH